MAYTIDYFNESIQAKFVGWPPGLRARYRALILRLIEYGPNLGVPHTRSLGEVYMRFGPRLPRETGAPSTAL